MDAGQSSGTVGLHMAHDGYLPPEDESGELVRFSVRVPKSVAKLFPLMAKVWNEWDALMGRHRRRAWTGASTMERMLKVVAHGFEKDVGGPQRGDESDDDFVKRAVSELKKKYKR